MIYKPYGNTGISVSALGLGTNRFQIREETEEEDLERAALIVKKALDSGVNYIDTAYTYSKGKAYEVLRRAFAMTKRPCHVTIKSAIHLDRTADEVLRRIESSLEELGIGQAAFFLAWTLTSYEDYTRIMKPGGYYEGAVKARERGLISHICFATHCPAKVTARIIREGAFDGVTVGYSLLSHTVQEPVLQAAADTGVGLTAMSALGTGSIVKNGHFFDFIRMEEQETLSQAALRFAAANRQVSIVLSGVSTQKQLEENLKAFSEPDPCPNRQALVQKAFGSISGFCDGCGSCEVCPKEIPVSKYMQAMNGRLTTNVKQPSYRRRDAELLKNIEICKKLRQDFAILPQNTKNPCDGCGKCEEKCPRGIRIQSQLKELYARMEDSSFSREAYEERLRNFAEGGFRRLGVCPAGGYTGYVLNYYEQFFGSPDFELLLFDNNPSLWGTYHGKYLIHSPEEIPKLNPDAIVIANYIYQKEIMDSLEGLTDHIRIIPLHHDRDVPWVF